MGQKIKMDMVKEVVVPRIATGLMSQLIKRKYLAITRSELIEMDALVTEENTLCLLDVVFAAMRDGWTDVTTYFNALHERVSPELSSIGKIKVGTECYLRELPLFKVKVIEYQKKSLFKKGVFKAQLIRTDFLDDVCKVMDSIAEKAGGKLYYGYAFGENTLKTVPEDYVFGKEELEQLEHFNSPFFRGFGCFIASLGNEITVGEIDSEELE